MNRETHRCSRWLASGAFCGLITTACTPDQDAVLPTGTGDGGATDTASEVGDITAVEVARSVDVPTVQTLTWTTSVPAVGRVVFGEGEQRALSTPWTTQLATSHLATLVGLAEGTAGTFVIEAMLDDGTVFSAAPGTLEAGVLGASLPRPTLVHGAENAPGFVLGVLQVGAGPVRWAFALDSQTRMVWALELSGVGHRVRLVPDGTGVVLFIPNAESTAVMLRRVNWDGSTHSELFVEGGRQDFDVIDPNTYVVLGHDLRTFSFTDGDAEIVGDTIIEVTTGGSRRELWNLFDHLGPDTSGAKPSDGESDEPIDWAHTNFLSHDPATDLMYITMRRIDASAAIHRATGVHAWTLAQDQGDFELTGDDRLLHNPHSALPLDDGVLLFNQAESDEGCAGAVAVQLDEGDATATRTWSYSADECLSMAFLGNAQPLPDGDTLVGFSQLGFFDEVSADGELLRRVELPFGDAFLYLQHHEQLGWPR